MSSSSNPSLYPLSAATTLPAIPSQAASAPEGGPAPGAAPAPDAGGAPTTVVAPDTEEVTLEHWIYGASPEKGYGTRAESSGLHPPLYVRHLAGHFTPVRVEKTTSGSTVVDARMIHPVLGASEVILSILGRGAADEYNRPTIQNHTVIIPAPLLRSGRLTFGLVERAAIDFDRATPTIRGTVEPLHVRLLPPRAEENPCGELRRLMTKAAVETLATRLMGDPHGRTLVLCRAASNESRNELLYQLLELLCIEAEIAMFPCISDAPTLSAMNHFRLAIASRGVRADASWLLLDSSMDKPALPNLRSRAMVYGRIARAYAT